MAEVERVYTSAPWERRYGYCRAIRAGGLILTTGTIAVDASGEIVAPNEAGPQTRRAYEIIEGAIGELGAAKTDIVRARLYVTDISRADEYGTAHRDFFDGHHPCLSMLGVSELIDPTVLVEIEVEAVVP